VVDFLVSCAAAGTRAVSFGGGEPLEYEGLFGVLDDLRGTLFRSLTTNGLWLDREGCFGRLVRARPDRVQVSLHHPGRRDEVLRVIRQVRALEAAGVRSGVNLLIRGSALPAAASTARLLRVSGVSHERITYLPMRGRDTPSPEQVAQVAGVAPFQSTRCLSTCGPSSRFCAVAWDRTVGRCSFTVARRRLETLDAAGLARALDGLGVEPCGNEARFASPQQQV
jgi:MoaA/NifB/PqqE/SkfB family radical SAM enzyme